MQVNRSFRIGDNVKAGSHFGKITRYDPITGYYEVTFDKHGLIPPAMMYPVSTLILVKSKGKCPKCSEEYHETKWKMHVWYDCIKCNKTKEDLEGDTNEEI